jgi:hypothetical protein
MMQPHQALVAIAPGWSYNDAATPNTSCGGPAEVRFRNGLSPVARA